MYMPGGKRDCQVKIQRVPIHYLGIVMLNPLQGYTLPELEINKRHSFRTFLLARTEKYLTEILKEGLIYT
jgi:hypothetical protein